MRSLRLPQAASRRVLLGAAAVVAVAGGLSVPAAHRDRDRASDVARIRSLIAQYPTFPGAEAIGESVYEYRGDGEATGEFGLTIVYRLPPTTTAHEVFDFYRDHLPAGWSEASDETCAALRPEVPPGEAFAGEWVLLEEPDLLTTFAPRGAQRGEGVSFHVQVTDGENRLEVFPPSLTCTVREPT